MLYTRDGAYLTAQPHLSCHTGIHIDGRIHVAAEHRRYDTQVDGGVGDPQTACDIEKHILGGQLEAHSLLQYSQQHIETSAVEPRGAALCRTIGRRADQRLGLYSPVFPVPDVIHNNKKIKKYIFLYDLIPYIFSDKYKEHLKPTTWFSKLLGSLSNDEIYFAISECTKRDFLKYFPKLKEENIVVTLLGYNENFYKADAQSQSMVRQKYGIPLNGKYVFSLCNIEERKNLIREIKTFADFINKNHIDDMYFVLGGAKVQSFIEIFEKSIDSLDFVKNRIIRAGYIDDEDLAPLYSGAEWFVYTSQYEGFGLPPLEAMACGCPVITSNSSSLPEVVGDAGIMIDWDSDEQHIQAYEKYYFDKEFRNSMAEKGIERASQFSWTKCADIMINKMKRDCENA